MKHSENMTVALKALNVFVDDEVLKEKEKERIACSAMAETFLNFISENGLSDEYEKFKRK